METFVVRLYVPAETTRDPEALVLRGFAEHVRGGERTAFCGDELLAFLESILLPDRADESDGAGFWHS